MGGAPLATTSDGKVFCAAFDRGQGRLIVLSVPRGLGVDRAAVPALPRLFAHLTRDLILVPGIDRVVKKLHATYSLGLIADQPHQILEFLKRKRMLSYFKVLAISGALGINKPEKKIFEWAVNQAGCSFSKTVMVGDRFDRDILPAKQLDMRTVLVRWNTYRKGFRPQTREEKLYLKSLDGIPNWQVGPAGPADRPDRLAFKVGGLPEIIDKLN